MGDAAGIARLLPLLVALAGVAGVFLPERALDAPVVREVQFAPAAIVVVGVRVGEVAAEIAARTRIGHALLGLSGRRPCP